MKHISKNKKGFTLVEVAVMVTVVSILTLLVYFGVATGQSESRNTAMITNADNYKSAYKTYRTINNTYPTQSTNNDNNITCLGTGYKDTNGDGTGDCYFATTLASEDPQVVDQLKSQLTGSVPPGLTKVTHPVKGLGRGGIFSSKSSEQVIVDGRPRKYYIAFVLEGYDRPCKISDVVKINGWPTASGWPNGTLSGARNTETWQENGGGTLCITLLPG